MGHLRDVIHSVEKGLGVDVVAGLRAAAIEQGRGGPDVSHDVRFTEEEELKESSLESESIEQSRKVAKRKTKRQEWKWTVK